MAELISSVFLVDPDSHEQIVLAAGSTPEPRLACLVTNPSAWAGGVVPDFDLEPGPDTAAKGGEPPEEPAGAGEGNGPGAEAGPEAEGAEQGELVETEVQPEAAEVEAAPEAAETEEQPAEAAPEEKPAARRGRKSATAE
ncbi:hypothetical protein ABTX81_30575 [Kitasatospora sp. NPDC097605]|uniref:hypothetical protein n=1 Tax=Kitasatospora sp. NPDC097605 TaxID=3157226 RepID=UPI00332104A2